MVIRISIAFCSKDLFSISFSVFGFLCCSKIDTSDFLYLNRFTSRSAEFVAWFLCLWIPFLLFSILVGIFTFSILMLVILLFLLRLWFLDIITTNVFWNRFQKFCCCFNNMGLIIYLAFWFHWTSKLKMVCIFGLWCVLYSSIGQISHRLLISFLIHSVIKRPCPLLNKTPL